MKIVSLLFGALTALVLSSHAQVYLKTNVSNVPANAKIKVLAFENEIDNEEIVLGNDSLQQGTAIFRFPWKLTKIAYVQIADQRARLFLTPGDSLVMNVNYEAFDSTLQFTGRGAVENNILAAFERTGYMAANYYMSYNDANLFEQYVDSLEALANAFLKANDSEKLNPLFRKYLRAEVKYVFINPRYMYTVGYNAKTNAFYTKATPPNYFDFFNKMDLNDEDAPLFGAYQTALFRYIEIMFESKNFYYDSTNANETMRRNIVSRYDFRLKTFKGKIRDYLLTNFMLDNISNMIIDLDFTHKYMNAYQTIVKDPIYVNAVNKAFNQAASFTKGKPAPEFNITDQNGNNYTLAKLKGKIIVIDFWATWCVPCRVSLPKMQALEKRFESNKNVVFLYISVDDDFKNWEKFVQKQHMNGIQIFADETKSKMLNKAFKIEGIPRHVLIDQAGNFIEASCFDLEKAEKLINQALYQ